MDVNQERDPQGQLTSKGRECVQTSGGWLIGEDQALSADALTFLLRVFMYLA